MILCKRKQEIQTKISLLKSDGKSIGFVPTMGALHKGHLSLIEESKRQCNITVCSIFINPTQFNDLNDFNKYPVTIETDILQLTEAGADILFLPSVNEMYPDGISHLKYYGLGELETFLEGEYRPGHFQGVCNVVHRLFDILQPHKAFFGQKDYQQCMVIKKLVELENLPIDIVIHQTIREPDGLAMSSRNLRLTEEEKERASALYKALLFIKENKWQNDVPNLTLQATEQLIKAGFSKVDYFEICDAETLHRLRLVSDAKQAVAVVAAYMNDVRLIDNMLL